MAVLAPYAFFQLLDNNGDPLSGGKLYTYEAGTSTPKVTYTDELESTQNANPVILDSAGRANVWLGSGEYKFILRDSSDNLISTVDDISGIVTGESVSYDISVNTNIVASYDKSRIFATGTISLNLLAASDAEDGFEFYVRNEGAGVVTIDPDTSETINGAATLSLQPGAWVIVYCDGTNWRAFSEGNGTIKVSANDTTLGFLEDKILVGTAITLSTQNDGANETRTFNLDLANQSQAEAGTSDVVLMTPLKTKNAIDSLSVFTESFESSEITISTGDNEYTVAHGLTGTPKMVEAVLRCKAADGNYAVGNEVVLTGAYEAGNGTYTTYKNATNVALIQHSNLQFTSRNSGFPEMIPVYANWKLVFRAYY